MVGQRQGPIIKLVFREGTWISGLVCCKWRSTTFPVVFTVCFLGIPLFTVPYSLITGHAKPHVVLM